MTNLSDEDLAAIGHVRGLLDAMPRDDRRNLERVLALAGEEPAEPEDQTFWYDPQDRIVYHRDDLQNPGLPYNWYAAGRMSGESWRDMGAARRRLVQLILATEAPEPQTLAAGQYHEVLMELLGAWEAEHRKGCGSSGRLSKCTYRDCKAYWMRLHSLGVRTTWETVTS